MSDSPVVGRCGARASLAGNPSDGYGGAVVSIPVDSVMATVRAERADRFEIQPSPSDDDTFDDLDHLVRRVDQVGYGDARQLMLATLRSLLRHVADDIDPLRLRASSTIPRSVGLAGSSAIVIATMRAVCEAHPSASWARQLADDPALQASIALDAETRELGIAAGLQDRVVQCMGVPALMEFSELTPLTTLLASGRYEQLPPPPGAIFVASIAATAEPSGVVHTSLRTEFDADRGQTRELMSEIADHGRAAARAIRRADIDALGAAMDATLDIRRSMMVLDPRHLAMADAVRSCGCHANWSGSGGSITVLAPNDAVADEARRTLRDDLDSALIEI